MKQVTKRVGVVLHLSRPYDRAVARAVAALGGDLGWDWMVLSPRLWSLTKKSSLVELDGVIGCLADAPGARALLGPAVPTVDVSPAAAGDGGVRVGGDDVAVGRVAAAHLLSLGLPHYGYLGQGDGEGPRARERGFAEAVAAAGLSHRSFYGASGDEATAAEGSARSELGRWVTALGRPAGVFAGDDGQAIQVLATCRRLGLNVPGDVAVLGAGNDEVLCELGNPSLSSVAVATAEIGFEAAWTLERMMAGGRPPAATTLLPPAGVVLRRSTGLKPILDAEVAAAVRYIALHAKDGVRVADVLREVQVSRRTLDQHFLAAVGRTPAQEIARVRLELAKQLLAETKESIERVAAMAGFSNAKHLGSRFRGTTGATPTAFRRRGRDG